LQIFSTKLFTYNNIADARRVKSEYRLCELKTRMQQTNKAQRALIVSRKSAPVDFWLIIG